MLHSRTCSAVLRTPGGVRDDGSGIERAGGRRSADLNDRIASVLRGDAVTSAEVSALLEEAEQAAAAATALAEATRTNALDPLLSSADAARAKSGADDAAFRADRLTAAMASLKNKLADAKAEEAEAKRRADYDKARAERDRIAAELREFYPQAERRLAKLIPELDANDQELKRINTQALPRDAERLQSAELIARGLDGWKIGVNEVTRITSELSWPRFEANPHDPLTWPPKRRYA